MQRVTNMTLIDYEAKIKCILEVTLLIFFDTLLVPT